MELTERRDWERGITWKDRGGLPVLVPDSTPGCPALEMRGRGGKRGGRVAPDPGIQRRRCADTLATGIFKPAATSKTAGATSEREVCVRGGYELLSLDILQERRMVGVLIPPNHYSFTLLGKSFL